jgi:hypothetical protein
MSDIINLAGSFRAEEAKREAASGLNLLIEARRTQVQCLQVEVEELIQLRRDTLLAFTGQLGAGEGPMDCYSQLLSLYQDSIVVSDYQHKRYLSVFHNLSPDPTRIGQKQSIANEQDPVLDVSVCKIVLGLTQSAHARVPGGPGSVLQVILADMANILGAKRALVYWLHPDPVRQSLVAYTSSGTSHTVHGRKVRNRGIAGHVIRSGVALSYLYCTSQHTHYSQSVDGEAVQSLVAEPMRSNGLGALVCGCIVLQGLVSSHHAATATLAAFAPHLSCALKNSRIDEEICLLE